jgi:hypothetical protein
VKYLGREFFLQGVYYSTVCVPLGFVLMMSGQGGQKVGPEVVKDGFGMPRQVDMGHNVSATNITNARGGVQVCLQVAGFLGQVLDFLY